MRRYILLLILWGNGSLFAALPKALTIGVPPASPPFTILQGTQGKLGGFSIDMMSAICARLKVNCTYRKYSFSGTFDAVMRGEVDLAIGNITITKARMEYMLFSLPYLPSAAQFITLANAPINTLNNLSGQTVGAEQGGIYADYIKQRFSAGMTVVTYPLLEDMMLALSDGEINAAILDQQTAESWYANNDNLFKLLGEPIPIGDGFGIMATKDSTELIQAVNAALLSMESDGQYTKIYNTYFSGITPSIGPKS